MCTHTEMQVSLADSRTGLRQVMDVVGTSLKGVGVGAGIGARGAGVRFAAFADAAAPGSSWPRGWAVGQLVQQRTLR